MRLLALVFLVALLAGCTFPGTATDEDKPDPLFGLCPQWEQGPGGYSSGVHLTAGDQTGGGDLGIAAQEHQGRPLDLYRINLTKLTVDGRLELRAFDASGQQLAIRDYRQASPQMLPVVVFTNGKAVGQQFEVYLSPVTSEQGPTHDAPASLAWSLEGAQAEVAFDVTFHYKVCGSGDL